MIRFFYSAERRAEIIPVERNFFFQNLIRVIPA
jgi:hypothetical protein